MPYRPQLCGARTRVLPHYYHSTRRQRRCYPQPLQQCLAASLAIGCARMRLQTQHRQQQAGRQQKQHQHRLKHLQQLHRCPYCVAPRLSRLSMPTVPASVRRDSLCYSGPAVRLRCVLIKVSGREPEDLSPEFPATLHAFADACGFNIAGIFVRRGCVELMVDIEDADVDQEENHGSPSSRRGAAAAGNSPVRMEGAAGASAVTISAVAGMGADSAVQPAAVQAGQAAATQPWRRNDSGSGGASTRLDLKAREGALALAQRVHDSVVSDAGDAHSKQRLLIDGASPRTPRAADGAAATDSGPDGGGGGHAVATTSTLLLQASLVRTVTLGQSSFVPLPKGPEITRVEPRVVVTRPSGVGGRRGGGGAPGTLVGGVGRDRSGALHGRPLPPVLEESDPWVQPAGAVTLRVRIVGPPFVPSGGGGDDEAARPLSSVPADSVPLETPPVELLVRCNGRYLPVQIQLDPEPSMSGEASDAPYSRDGCPDVAALSDVAAPATAAVRSYLVTLLEPPPVGCGVMLIDLRWRGRPAQVVPVVLLEEQDAQLLGPELSAVAATWTGPPQELDGLLYDFGAWMRCMAARRAARVAAGAAALSAAVASAETLREVAATAAAAAAPVATAGGPGHREPPYIPVLGASLLQFAHSQGLMGMAARLQLDMRVCGYRAPFSRQLRGRIEPSPVAMQPPTAEVQHRHRAPIATPAAAVEASTTAAVAASTTATTVVVTSSHHVRLQPVGASTAVQWPAWPRHGQQPGGGNGSGGGASDPAKASGMREASHGKSYVPLGVSVRSEAPMIGAVDHGGEAAVAAAATAAAQVAAPTTPAGSAVSGVRRRPGRLSEAVRLAMGPWSGQTMITVAPAGHTVNPWSAAGSYPTFVESYNSAMSYLFHLLDALSILELMCHLVRLAAENRLTAGGGRGSGGQQQRLLLLLLILATLPSAVASLVWLVLPRPVWNRVAPIARFLRHACLVSGRVVSLSGGLQLGCYSRLCRGAVLGPGALVMEGVVVPTACLLSPSAALLFAAVKLPLYIAASRAAATAATTATTATATGSEAIRIALANCSTTVSAAIQGSPAAAAVAAAAVASPVPPFSECAGCAFRAFAVSMTALVTTLACHAHLRLQFRRRTQAAAGGKTKKAEVALS